MAWMLPGSPMTVYEVMGLPPVASGAVKSTRAWVPLHRALTACAGAGATMEDDRPHHVVLFMAQDVAVPDVFPAEVGHPVGRR